MTDLNVLQEMYEREEKALRDEIAAKELEAAACKRRTAELNAYTSQTIAEIKKVLSHPNFPASKRGYYLEKLKELEDSEEQ